MQMEYKRILCAYLDHTPNGIRDPNRQILMTLLANCYSAEDLARDIVASIIRQVRSIVEEERSDLSPDVIVNYWYEVAATSHSPSATSTSFHAIAQAYHASSTPRRNNRISPSFGSIPGTSGLLTGSGHSDPQPTPKPTARHHENPDVDRILSQAYNDIGFTWTTDFLLYRESIFISPRFCVCPLFSTFPPTSLSLSRNPPLTNLKSYITYHIAHYISFITSNV